MAVELDVSVQTAAVAVFSVAVMVAWTEGDGLHAQTRKKTRRIRNDLGCIVFGMSIQGNNILHTSRHFRAAVQDDYTANLPVSNCPKALCRSVGFRIIAIPRTPEPMEISSGTKTDSSARTRIG